MEHGVNLHPGRASQGDPGSVYGKDTYPRSTDPQNKSDCLGGTEFWSTLRDSHSWMSGLQTSLPTSLLGRMWEEKGEMRSDFQ